MPVKPVIMIDREYGFDNSVFPLVFAQAVAGLAQDGDRAHTAFSPLCCVLVQGLAQPSWEVVAML